MKEINDLELGFYSVNINGEWKRAELIEPDYLKCRAFLIDGEDTPTDISMIDGIRT